MSYFSTLFRVYPAVLCVSQAQLTLAASILERYAPAQADQLKGRLAEKDKNYALAESEFEQAVEASNQPADAWMALASFYSRRHQTEPMLAALHAGIGADAKSEKPNGPALVEGAGLLTRNNLDLPFAVELLRQYLASPNKSTDSPAFQVSANPGRLLEQQGDQQGARQELQAAAVLAHAYRPSGASFGSD
jgi:tetratricopeptide (TPR) repeat protein